MKLQIDTTSKTIKLEEDVKISKLIEALEKMLPKDYKDFTLETNTEIVNWTSPIVIKEYTRPTYPYYPWYCSTDNTQLKNSTNSVELKSGVYNVEC